MKIKMITNWREKTSQLAVYNILKDEIKIRNIGLSKICIKLLIIHEMTHAYLYKHKLNLHNLNEKLLHLIVNSLNIIYPNWSGVKIKC